MESLTFEGKRKTLNIILKMQTDGLVLSCYMAKVDTCILPDSFGNLIELIFDSYDCVVWGNSFWHGIFIDTFKISNKGKRRARIHS